MFTTCLFCKRPLGSNEVIETFPVGRRLAFDAARGRLWVVCRKCERWNLTPLEERWEAVEDCERIFRGTRLRVSTENIGLARHPEGLTLVRIGEPLRPEFAAWRYGDQFGRRRRKVGLYTAAGLGAAAAGGWVVGTVVAGSILMMLLIGTPWQQRRKVVEIPQDGRRTIVVRSMDVSTARLRLAEDGASLRLQVSDYSSLLGEQIWLEGEDARRVAGVILPAVNKAGGKKRTVADAVELIEAAGSPERLVTDLASANDFNMNDGSPGYIWKMPVPTRLALEMALHEEQERRALEGELWLLEQAWREAEEIAGIADDLLLPEGADDFVREHRQARARTGGRGENRGSARLSGRSE
ncbi:MAG: hypothetical protein F4237_00335 [Gemmatimonadetes bacterium]|nr:hypothetical protein [Gemmatimonadota bacterium]MYE68478.1 hypothetical protein [Gemmatimonadota bacterium]